VPYGGRAADAILGGITVTGAVPLASMLPGEQIRRPGKIDDSVSSNRAMSSARGFECSARQMISKSIVVRLNVRSLRPSRGFPSFSCPRRRMQNNEGRADVPMWPERLGFFVAPIGATANAARRKQSPDAERSRQKDRFVVGGVQSRIRTCTKISVKPAAAFRRIAHPV